MSPAGARSERSADPGGFFRAADEPLRAPFIEQVEAACAALGIDLTWSSSQWIATMERGGRRQRVAGYTFGLNDSAAVELAVDKGAASSVLSAASIAAVRHREWTFGGLGSRECAELVAGAERLPVVAKPVRGHSGADVHRAGSVDELAAVFDAMRERYKSVAVSPLVEDADEYRLIVLSDRVLLAFVKRRPAAKPGRAAEWRHNAEFGSTGEVLGEESPLYGRLAELARAALGALGLRVGAVDVFVSTAGMQVLEVNDAFTLNRFSLESPERFELAAGVVLAVIGACFDDPVAAGTGDPSGS